MSNKIQSPAVLSRVPSIPIHHLKMPHSLPLWQSRKLGKTTFQHLFNDCISLNPFVCHPFLCSPTSNKLLTIPAQSKFQVKSLCLWTLRPNGFLSLLLSQTLTSYFTQTQTASSFIQTSDTSVFLSHQQFSKAQHFSVCSWRQNSALSSNFSTQATNDDKWILPMNLLFMFKAQYDVSVDNHIIYSQSK